jgi:hypothetical protein
MGRIWIMRQICVILVCHEYGHVWVEEYDLLYSLQLCACLIYVICVCLRIEVSSPRFLCRPTAFLLLLESHGSSKNKRRRTAEESRTKRCPTHIVLFYRINKRHENSFNCERVCLIFLLQHWSNS